LILQAEPFDRGNFEDAPAGEALGTVAINAALSPL
jgi:hypothetical protein